MRNEKIIVSLTTWKPRIGNIPTVLDTIFKQTKIPDKVVLNLSFDENIPGEVQNYLDCHNVEVFRVADTKVYKKLIPTLLRYPDDCIISIDDDFLYPETMIEDFWKAHLRFPDFPISGNTIVLFGMQCHCGCASLTKADFFGEYLPMIDNTLMENCLSDDIVYTFLSTKNHHPYLRSKCLYFDNMESYNPADSYTESNLKQGIVGNSYTYLTKRFGRISPCDVLFGYSEYDNIFDTIKDIGIYHYMEVCKSTYSYRIGYALLSPFIFIRKKLLLCKRSLRRFVVRISQSTFAGA